MYQKIEEYDRKLVEQSNILLYQNEKDTESVNLNKLTKSGCMLNQNQDKLQLKYFDYD